MLQTLSDELSGLRSNSDQEAILRGLLRAGELECAVADNGAEIESCERITDRIADLLVGNASDCSSLRAQLEHVHVPEEAQLSAPEGFAYYALHPLSYADVVAQLPQLSRDVVAIGIRSIGTTLSSVTAAAVRRLGKTTARFTVRPCGHPYNRQTELTPGQLQVVQHGIECDADFLVVDEGPGLSGSSFLSVAEALVRAGVAHTKVSLICGHQPNFGTFCSEDGARRAARFRWVAAQSEIRKPSRAATFAGAGDWRKHLLAKDSEWPATWTNLEREKYLSSVDDREPRLFKFSGYGHYGDEVLKRETLVAEAGFGPSPARAGHGFAGYPQLSALPMSQQDLDEAVLERLAAYCAFRQQTFRTALNNVGALQEMAEHNLQQLEVDVPLELKLEQPVIADARMQPHEWLVSPDGHIWKTDSGSHGDDHFFPGRTDIAWDLAGAIVEWNMRNTHTELFLSRYERLTGDRASRRIGDYIIAYSAFRCAYCLMAANALQGTGEEQRLRTAAAGYKQLLVSCAVTAAAIG